MLLLQHMPLLHHVSLQPVRIPSVDHEQRVLDRTTLTKPIWLKSASLGVYTLVRSRILHCCVVRPLGPHATTCGCSPPLGNYSMAPATLQARPFIIVPVSQWNSQPAPQTEELSLFSPGCNTPGHTLRASQVRRRCTCPIQCTMTDNERRMSAPNAVSSIIPQYDRCFTQLTQAAQQHIPPHAVVREQLDNRDCRPNVPDTRHRQQQHQHQQLQQRQLQAQQPERARSQK